MLQISIEQRGGEELRQELARIDRSVDRVRWHKVWAQAVAKKARSTARSKGGRRFWAEVAAATQVASVDASGAVVAVDHVAAAQKQYGGTIRGKNGKMLTIPISAEAEGKRAYEFEAGGRKLFAIRAHDGSNAILGYDDGDAFRALYLLKDQVTQAPEPWFPDATEIAGIGIAEGLRLLEVGRA